MSESDSVHYRAMGIFTVIKDINHIFTFKLTEVHKPNGKGDYTVALVICNLVDDTGAPKITGDANTPDSICFNPNISFKEAYTQLLNFDEHK